jgi:hypothetical protein
MKRALAAIVLLSGSSLAAAQTCGQRVDADLRLDRDLHCPGAAALRVARSGVTIDLAGHTISGGLDTNAIEATAVRDVRIVGPGRIAGVGTGIEATRVQGLSVTGVAFDHVGSGVRLHNSSRSEVAHNTFDHVAGHAVVVLSLPHALTRGNAHAIHDNVITRSEYGVLLDGHDAGDSIVADNRFDDIGAIAILDAAGGNRTDDNAFGNVGVADIAIHAWRTITGARSWNRSTCRR